MKFREFITDPWERNMRYGFFREIPGRMRYDVFQSGGKWLHSWGWAGVSTKYCDTPYGSCLEAQTALYETIKHHLTPEMIRC